MKRYAADSFHSKTAGLESVTLLKLIFVDDSETIANYFLYAKEFSFSYLNIIVEQLDHPYLIIIVTVRTERYY